MLADRNRLFRLAAVATAGAGLVLGIGELVSTDHYLHERVLGGVEAGEGIRAAAHLVGVVGWLLIAAALDSEIDWRRLRVGASVVVATAFAYLVGSALWTIAVAGSEASTNDRLTVFFGSIADLLLFGAVAVVASGLSDANRGGTRAGRLRHGGYLVAASFVASTVAILFEQAYYGEHALIPEVQKIGLDVLTVGAFIPVIAAAIFARGVARPLPRREAALVAAGMIAAAGTTVIVAGEVLIGVGYHEAHLRGEALTSIWLAVAARVLSALAYLLAALAAGRAARRRAPADA